MAAKDTAASVASYEIAQYDGKKTTLFNVVVTFPDNKQGAFARRYSEFRTFFDSLKKACPEAKAFPFPAKKGLFGDNFKPAFLEKRRKTLDDFVKRATTDNRTKQHPLVKKFFFQPPPSGSSSPAASAASAAALVPVREAPGASGKRAEDENYDLVGDAAAVTPKTKTEQLYSLIGDAPPPPVTAAAVTVSVAPAVSAAPAKAKRANVDFRRSASKSAGRTKLKSTLTVAARQEISKAMAASASVVTSIDGKPAAEVPLRNVAAVLATQTADVQLIVESSWGDVSSLTLAHGGAPAARGAGCNYAIELVDGVLDCKTLAPPGSQKAGAVKGRVTHVNGKCMSDVPLMQTWRALGTDLLMEMV